ncbi:hypothetical protein PHYSODRAFT_472228 [Phytophthora sojae]|uniref:SAM domain-containing protein n=1 Tax=Phytophthora sojae (strain P6497) TaxID=1094619 RepID=G4YL48_PHYSP|nr:hypothetical protein PHYSODRAFT_472228 [Phytophthora sojae]EGZ29803.1 hypothetical protein PHYSODRAFT_472228 [Phytophthora sojae]|eukprot:XP_009517078.1 hypothetical protein PHYSODRAFT_472228 [Phytophthora sojae]
MTSLAPESTTLHGSASAPLIFPPCASFEKPYDLDIVKKIVEREGCLEALQQLLEAAKKPQQPRISGISKAPIVFQSVIDQLRSVSVQIVEDIDRWQQQQKAKAQATNFKWRSVNYLLKMTADTDFLASFRGVALLESLQVLRLTQNPFLALMHLDHPALRDEDPEPAVQLFGNWVGDVSMRRVFPASRILLREREADARRRQIRLKLAAENGEEEDESGSVAAIAPLERQQQPTPATRSKVGFVGQDRACDGAASTNPREVAMREDIALSRELITQAEHELGAMRDELAGLQARLEDAILPDKRRRLQIRIGSLVNDLRFRSGDVYQRKNEFKRKEAIYRAIKDRRGSNTPYSSLFETALLEDEQARNDLVLRVNTSLSKARVDEHKRSMGVVMPNVEQWGVRDVQNFLDSLGLDNGSYGANFRAQGIDGALLVQATDQDLEELGVTIRLHRVRILAECRMRRDIVATGKL